MKGLRARWARWQTWSGPRRRLKITRIGRTYLFITLGVGLAALNTGNNLLYLVLGFLLSIIVLSGVLSERMLKDLTVRRLLPPGAFAFEPFPLRYEVAHPCGRAFAVRISEGHADLAGSAWVPTLAPGEMVVAPSDVTAPKRGPLRLGDIELSTLFPFGLFEKTRLVEQPGELLVWPRRGLSCQMPTGATGQAQGAHGISRARDGSGDVQGLRELQDSEDARHVHWKKSASSVKVLKVEREREDRRQYTLRLASEQPGEPLERACEETAALAHRLLAEGHEVGLEAGLQRLRPGAGLAHERRVLSALAQFGFGPSRSAK